MSAAVSNPAIVVRGVFGWFNAFREAMRSMADGSVMLILFLTRTTQNPL